MTATSTQRFTSHKQWKIKFFVLNKIHVATLMVDHDLVPEELVEGEVTRHGAGSWYIRRSQMLKEHQNKMPKTASHIRLYALNVQIDDENGIIEIDSNYYWNWEDENE